MAARDLKTEYQAAKSDIANLLGFFECELGKEPNELHWGHLGNLKRVRESLVETLSFMSGISIAEIEETLEIANL